MTTQRILKKNQTTFFLFIICNIMQLYNIMQYYIFLYKIFDNERNTILYKLNEIKHLYTHRSYINQENVHSNIIFSKS